MKRILYVLLAALAMLAAGCNPEVEFVVTPTTLEFDGNEGTQTVSVTAGATWVAKIGEDAGWLTSSKTIGKTSAEVEISVTANGPEPRSSEIQFASDGQVVTVTVNQAAGNAQGTVEKGEFYPDPASGIEVDPVCPDADKACTIKFNPASDNPLYGHSGELYAHLGVIVEGEWKFVPSDWGTTDEKVHFKKVADNSYELKLEPSVREYFGSGETPVTRIAIIVRTADGNTKSHDADQFCSVTDNKYKAEEFNPEVVTKKMPEGVQHGINYNEDNSVTFVLYDQDKSKQNHRYCYIVGDWNGWERKDEGAMFWDGSQGCWWITLDGFDADFSSEGADWLILPLCFILP